MACVMTVRGPVSTKDLGVTLMHEHLSFGSIGAPQDGGPFEEIAFALNLEMLKAARDVGIRTIVELTPWPNIGRIVELNDKVPELHIVVSTGCYTERCGHPSNRLPDEAFYERMVYNITEGYEGSESTGVRAGIIKIAGAKSNLTDWERRRFRLAARVQQECRVPIATHACAGAREQMEVLRGAGADIHATFYSHVEAKFGWDGRTVQQEARYLADVARAGGFLQFNNFGFEFDTPFSDMLYLIDYLERSGLGEKIFLSVDTNFTIDETGRVWKEAERQHPETGKRSLAYCITHAVPMLMGAGVSLPRINRYLIGNPRRFFEALH